MKLQKLMICQIEGPVCDSVCRNARKVIISAPC